MGLAPAWPLFHCSSFSVLLALFWKADSPELAKGHMRQPSGSPGFLAASPFREVVAITPTVALHSLPHLPSSKGCSRSQESLGTWHRWRHRVTLGLTPEVGGWGGSRGAGRFLGSQRPSCQQPSALGAGRSFNLPGSQECQQGRHPQTKQKQKS